METLIQRLVVNPHDQEALAYAHHAGTVDPRSYALLLEQVGERTADPAYAAHWLSEAAAVWSTTLGDAHHAARTLMIAIEKDPTQRTAADRLAQLYREKGDQKALVALLERLVKSLSPLLVEKPEVRGQLVALHEELGRLWGEPPLARPERALENWRRLAELDPQNAYAIYAARELLKAQQQYADAVPYFAMEQAIVDDPERKLALYRDEADIRRRAGDLAGVTHALRSARALRPDDVAVVQELGLSILERIDAGQQIPPHERDEATALFVTLAETYDGEYGLNYSLSALRAGPGHDRAMQLADYYAGALGRVAEIAPQYAGYLQANPNGFMAAEARVKAGSALPPPPPAPPAPPPAPVQPVSERASSSNPSPFSSSPERSSAPTFGSAPPVERVSASAASPVGPTERPSGISASPIDRPSTSTSGADLGTLLEGAQAEAQKGRKPQALAKFREALKLDPANPEALSWVEEHLRQKRMYADLRDVLLAASRVPSVSADTRKAQLRDVAGLCESQLRDLETAILAWKQICQIDRGDDQARDQLRRLLERASRWDDLATLLEQEAMSAPEVEQKIALEKKLATLHEAKRKDPAAAAEAWGRIAGLSPEDDSAIQTAVKLYEKAERFDLASQVIADNLPGVTDTPARATLLQKLGELREKTGDLGGAGDAYAEAADMLNHAKAWELAEKAFLGSSRFADAAGALDRRAELTEGKQQAALLGQSADLWLKAGEASAALAKLEKATELDPTNDAFAQAADALYRSEGREADLVTYLLGRAEKLGDKARRVDGRRTAAALQRQLGDREGARESLLLLVKDGDDAEALATLLDDAEERGDHEESADLLRRLGAISDDPQTKLDLAMREAAVFAESLNDVDGAIERYEAICRALDPKSREALRAVADLEERRDNPKGVAEALERELALTEGDETVEIAQRLAQLYEGPLDNPRSAIRALDLIHAADPEDFDAIARLEKLAESVEDWPRVATLSAMLIEVEGDEEEASRMTLRLADIQNEKIGKGDDALATLERMADQGDVACRDAYIELGDRLGWKGIVATKLVAWNESFSGPMRNESLRGAFDRFLEIGRETDAARVAIELARSRAGGPDLASKLEDIAVRTRDLDALGVAHDILAGDLSGADRATELVRQAEVQVAAGVDPDEAMRHGETALASTAPGEVEPLLARLATLTQAPGHVIDLYERQVARCRAPGDRLAALARAAQVAADHGANDRARGFFELALGGGVQEETIGALDLAARSGDERAGGYALRTILAEALAAGGQGSRDGGRTRGALLRRAATIAYRDLRDIDRAFRWLGDAIITHVDDASLDALDELGAAAGDLQRVEATIGRALEEVFDGPLVRKLLHRRAKLRREVIGDRKGAAADLKKLHDLSPSDLDVMNDLSGLLLELGDHRGMIQLYEDQILRGRDPAVRAELARKVARIWEEDLGDARETADAWRRVLRMKAADPEATAGLERAKTGKLKRPPPPPAVPSQPAAAAAYDPGYAPAPGLDDGAEPSDQPAAAPPYLAVEPPAYLAGDPPDFLAPEAPGAFDAAPPDYLAPEPPGDFDAAPPDYLAPEPPGDFDAAPADYPAGYPAPSLLDQPPFDAARAARAADVTDSYPAQIDDPLARTDGYAAAPDDIVEEDAIEDVEDAELIEETGRFKLPQ